MYLRGSWPLTYRMENCFYHSVTKLNFVHGRRFLNNNNNEIFFFFWLEYLLRFVEIMCVRFKWEGKPNNLLKIYNWFLMNTHFFTGIFPVLSTCRQSLVWAFWRKFIVEPFSWVKLYANFMSSSDQCCKL